MVTVVLEGLGRSKGKLNINSPCDLNYGIKFSGGEGGLSSSLAEGGFCIRVL